MTSTSLMVDMPGAQDAALAAAQCPALSVGLHLMITEESGWLLPGCDLDHLARDLDRQVRRFVELRGGPPTHLDSHHNTHRHPRLSPAFFNLADRYRLPLRDHSPVRHHSSFYGQWDGVTHLEQVSVESLLRMLEEEVREDTITELGCHPGYVDEAFSSSYAIEREAELQTLCDPRVTRAVADLGITLIGFKDFPALVQQA